MLDIEKRGLASLSWSDSHVDGDVPEAFGNWEVGLPRSYVPVDGKSLNMAAAQRRSRRQRFGSFGSFSSFGLLDVFQSLSKISRFLPILQSDAARTWEQLQRSFTLREADAITDHGAEHVGTAQRT